MQTCPICGKAASVRQPGDYKVCTCVGCGDFELSASAELAMRLGSYDGQTIGLALGRRFATGRSMRRIMESDLAVLHAEGSA